MNRFLIPAAVAALVVGCARPAVSGLQPYSSDGPYPTPVETTVIVREVHYQEPVVYTDTVYLQDELPSAEPVYVENEYNEYNEYNETYVYVSEPPHHRRHPGWSPREHEQRRSRPPRDEEKVRPPDEKPKPKPPNKPALTPPAKRTYVPVPNGRQKSPDKPTPPAQPTPPKRQAPAQGGSVPAAPVQPESPKRAPTPPADKSAGLGSGA
jgi:hypothetical protein